MTSIGMSYAEAAASPPPSNSPPGNSQSVVRPWSSHSSSSSPAKCCKPPLSTAGSKSGNSGIVEHSRPTCHFPRTGAGIGAGGGAHPILGVASPSNVARGDGACERMLTFQDAKNSALVQDSKDSKGSAEGGAQPILGVASPSTIKVARSPVKKMPPKQPRGPRGVNSNPGLNILEQAHTPMHARPWSIRGQHAMLSAQARGLGPEGVALIRLFAARPRAHPHKRTYA
jgi:hypothetical protein